ncbi:hypothetical protein CSKR_200985 [Clonorchis sinensis]|uniref:Uncharacterized protein n=1 Tax=Clonorchis sinensis TaxID=79923 RepID=A0A8T1MK37_CLOSI|nr:hypothetical protein CSKR_200985 [Clonorchis sinensis]
MVSKPVPNMSYRALKVDLTVELRTSIGVGLLGCFVKRSYPVPMECDQSSTLHLRGAFCGKVFERPRLIRSTQIRGPIQQKQPTLRLEKLRTKAPTLSNSLHARVQSATDVIDQPCYNHAPHHVYYFSPDWFASKP